MSSPGGSVNSLLTYVDPRLEGAESVRGDFKPEVIF